MSELWQWYHETELIEDEDDDISYEDRFNNYLKIKLTLAELTWPVSCLLEFR